MTPDDVRDMYIAREAIERAAARKVLDGDHAAAGRELLRIVDQMAEAETPAEVSELDIAFHELLLKPRPKPATVPDAPDLHHRDPHVYPFLDESYAKSEVRDRKEHRALANAIRKGNRELTDRLLTAHMDDAVNRLIHEPAVGT